MVATNGMVSVTVHPAQPSVVTFLQNWPAPPLVNVATSHVFYLDGDSAVKSLSMAGATAVVTHVPGGPRTLSAFAVSPDERRIAVSVFDYSKSPTPTIRLYVEDLAGGGNHADILDPSTPTWPVGWHDGNLVLASGPDQVGSNYPTANPYNSLTGYQIVDPATGTTLATIPKECRYGPLITEGTGCQAQQALAIGDWDGSMRVLRSSGLGGVGQYNWVTLAPGGDRIAGYIGPLQISVFNYSTSNGPNPPTPPPMWGGIPAGWIDENHLVFHPGAGGEVNDLGIWSFEFQSEIPIRLSCGDTGCQFAQFMGTLPGSLE